MIFLVPIVWPFLVIWLLFKCWRVTLPLAGMGITAVIFSHSLGWGAAVGLVLLLVVTWVAKIMQDDRAITDERTQVTALEQHRAAVDREYAGMQLQAELNAQAMARVAREQRF